MSTDKKVWRVRKGPKIFGPMTKEKLDDLLSSNRIDGNDLVSAGGDYWMPVSQWLAEQRQPAAPVPAPIPEPALAPLPMPMPAPQPMAPPPTPIGFAKWTYTRNGQPAGRASEDELRQLMAAGNLLPTDMVWQEGMAAPVTAGSLVGYAGSSVRVPSGAASRGMLGLAWIAAVLLGMALAGGAIGALWFYGLWPFKAGPVQRLSGVVSAEEITQTYRPRIYTVKAPAAQDRISTGSGILIANNKTRGLVATNLHVVSSMLENPQQLKNLPTAQLPKLEVAVKNPNQLSFKRARLAAIHRNNDLALLIIEVEADKSSALPILRKRNLHQGEAAVALGNPFDLEFFTSNGVISSTSGEGGLIWTSCPISPGNSGGPLFLNRRGILVGINTLSVVGRAQNLNGAVPAEDIVDSLHRRLFDSWVWAMELKDEVLELGDLVTLEDD